jgi:hypothetical protein
MQAGGAIPEMCANARIAGRETTESPGFLERTSCFASSKPIGVFFRIAGEFLKISSGMIP